MNIRQVALFFISIFIIVIFFNITVYQQWVNNRILKFNEDIYTDLEHMDLEERRIIRWGGPYAGTQSVKKFLDSIQAKKQLILLPPENYFNKYAPDFKMVEPVIFYYYSGLKATTVNNKDVYNATGCLLYINGIFTFQFLKSKKDIEEVLTHYKEATKS